MTGPKETVLRSINPLNPTTDHNETSVKHQCFIKQSGNEY